MHVASNRDLALAFIRCFCAGDVDGLEPLLADDLQWRGPFLTAGSRDEYLHSLRDDPPTPSSFRVLSVTENHDSVVVFYEYQKDSGALTIAQLFRLRTGRIREVLLVFDAREA